MNIINKKSKFSGFIFVEVLIAITLVTIVFVVLLGIVFLSLNISSSIKEKIMADFLAKEEIEAVRSFRDATIWETNGLGILNHEDPNPYYFTLNTSVNPPKWQINSGTETVGIFTRKVVFYQAYRDEYTNLITEDLSSCFIDIITEENSCEDKGTKKVVVTVTYRNNTHKITTYLTNWQNK